MCHVAFSHAFLHCADLYPITSYILRSTLNEDDHPMGFVLSGDAIKAGNEEEEKKAGTGEDVPAIDNDGVIDLLDDAPDDDIVLIDESNDVPAASSSTSTPVTKRKNRSGEEEDEQNTCATTESLKKVKGDDGTAVLSTEKDESSIDMIDLIE